MDWWIGGLVVVGSWKADAGSAAVAAVVDLFFFGGRDEASQAVIMNWEQAGGKAESD